MEKGWEEDPAPLPHLPSLPRTLYPVILLTSHFPVTGNGYELKGLNCATAHNGLLVQGKTSYELSLSHILTPLAFSYSKSTVLQGLFYLKKKY